MNRSLYTTAISVGLLIFAGAASANQVTLLNGDSIYGKPATSTAAAQVVDVSSAKNLRIPCGEVVTFRNGEKTFSWKFDVISHRTVNLQTIAPAGFSDKALMIYVEKNELERS